MSAKNFCELKQWLIDHNLYDGKYVVTSLEKIVEDLHTLPTPTVSCCDYE